MATIKRYPKAFAVFLAVWALTTVWGLSQVQAFSGPTLNVKAWTEDCGGAGGVDGGVATQVQITDGDSCMAYRCANPSSTVVYLGGSDVRGDGTAGYPICTDTASCSDSALTVDARNVYCSAASSVTVYCACLKN